MGHYISGSKKGESRAQLQIMMQLETLQLNSEDLSYKQMRPRSAIAGLLTGRGGLVGKGLVEEIGGCWALTAEGRKRLAGLTPEQVTEAMTRGKDGEVFLKFLWVE